MIRVDEFENGHPYKAASAKTKEFQTKICQLSALVESGFTKDEECCLVCGDTDYEDENMIGFCDLCGLSVHRECYGLEILDANTDFICYNCMAFGTQDTMKYVCILCNQHGGA